MTAITFVTPPPGLTARRFELLEEQTDGVYTLAALDAPGVELLVVDPSRWVPDYAPAIPANDLALIGASDQEPVVLVVATARGGAVSVNLMAPVLVHPDTGAAIQTILDGQGLDLRRELVTA
ncbi:flagellar assembly protein FliW [Oerskovia turbata]|uniref:Flagellar assembly protein FliW n=1 Tax=Oerskovia turbata TaxID=1713 RepID=A0A4Q1KTH7_9CELL|nr:flagellar assembly protein FliW [Oerskovia turbata]RXR23660.1 flagellar assembly protein FliW [Oerskovia turbata]RXR32930.1 flagellar assembly protein FliW [Oerskovia turbata]TGJ95225.1 flagellar assembly protein FliW [Actinotalea fermentans ATCC 43279 = JCM 9966 = DSM 3133]